MKPLMFSILIKILDILTHTMKKLSETLTELGIAFTFPIRIWDAKGYQTYYEDSNGYWDKYEWDGNGRATHYEDSDDYWERFERDAQGRPTYHEDSNGFWSRWGRDANGDVDYYEDSTGVKIGTPESLTKPLTESKELCAFCDKPDVFLKGLCPICFDDHYGD